METLISTNIFWWCTKDVSRLTFNILSSNNYKIIIGLTKPIESTFSYSDDDEQQQKEHFQSWEKFLGPARLRSTEGICSEGKSEEDSTLA